MRICNRRLVNEGIQMVNLLAVFPPDTFQLLVKDDR